MTKAMRCPHRYSCESRGELVQDPRGPPHHPPRTSLFLYFITDTGPTGSIHGHAFIGLGTPHQPGGPDALASGSHLLAGADGWHPPLSGLHGSRTRMALDLPDNGVCGR